MLGAILAGASIVGGLFSSKMQADAQQKVANAEAAERERVAKVNADLSLYDASVVRQEARQIRHQYITQLKDHFLLSNRLIERQKARFAKSGVVVGTGTPLEVMSDTARIAAIDGERIRYNGENAVQHRLSLAKRYEMLAEAGLRDASFAAQQIRDAGDYRASATRISGLTRALSGIYGLGVEYNWWD